MRRLIALAALCACSGPETGEKDVPAEGTKQTSPAAAAQSAVPQWPSDPCGWIPTAEVEAIVGKLAGPPRRHEGGCLYPLVPPPPDAETLRRQEVARKLQELAKKFGGSDLPPDRRPTEPAIILDVDLSRDVSEQATGAAESIAASWAGMRLDSAGPSKGWDYAQVSDCDRAARIFRANRRAQRDGPDASHRRR